MREQGLKPGNQTRQHWHVAENVVTDTVLVYLHGFSAGPGEAGELPEQMAQALAANLYVHRWPGHGLFSPDAMHGLTVQMLLDSARDALGKAKAMGRSVLMVGTSLGASLALWLAAHHPEDIAAIAAWSPGVRPADPPLLDQLCALQEPFVDVRPRSAEVQAFWSDTIHPDGYRALRNLFTMFAADPPWARVVCPVLLAYYRSPAGDEDQTASVAAMLEMFSALGAPPTAKLAMPFAAGVHGIGSPYKSPLADSVAQATIDFLRRNLPSSGHASIG